MDCSNIDAKYLIKPKTPRTPADIGRDIAAAQQTINALKAELADVPPENLTVEYDYGVVGDGRTVEFIAEHNPRIVVNRGSAVAGTRIALADVPRLRAWLNHYYPEDAS